MTHSSSPSSPDILSFIGQNLDFPQLLEISQNQINGIGNTISSSINSSDPISHQDFQLQLISQLKISLAQLSNSLDLAPQDSNLQDSRITDIILGLITLQHS